MTNDEKCDNIYCVKRTGGIMAVSHLTKGDTAMKVFYEDPNVEVMLLDVEDVVTASRTEDDYSCNVDLESFDK